MSSTSSGPMVHLLREALEGVLAPNVVSAVLLEALADGPELGADPAGLWVFIDESLASVLRVWVHEDTASEVLESVRAHLSAVLGGRTKVRGSQAPTATVTVEEGPVRVVLIGTRDRLANGLVGALGPDVVAPYFAPDASVATRMIGSLRPSIVLVDGASRLADAHVDAVAAAGDALVLVWAAASPEGQRVLARLQQVVAHPIALPHPGGGELLVDYVRARRTSAASRAT